MSSKLLTTPQAAELLGMSSESVRLRLADRTIAGGFRDRGRWRVPLEALEEYRLQGMPEPAKPEPIYVMPRRVRPLQVRGAARVG